MSSGGPAVGDRCRCCSYGFHIDTDFVQYAQDVNSGFATRATPTPTPHSSRTNGTGRPLMSPMDSIFSDSLENIMSDFEEALAPIKASISKSTKEKEIAERRQRMQNGYLSDYTSYRRGTSESNNNTVNGRSNGPRFELAKPPSRPNLLTNGSGSRCSTPLGGKSTANGFSTALGKAVSEIRARNAESPFPGQERELVSRVGTPIDLGLVPPTTPTPNGYSGHNGYSIHSAAYHGSTPSRVVANDFATPAALPPTPSSASTWRRTPSSGDVRGEFASLRRGREYALSDNEGASRIRYYSASPKMPRKLQVAAPIEDSHFTYTHTNGQTMLARTQATSMSPREDVPIRIPQTTTRSIAVSTGPLPPAKPCSDCPGLRKQLEEALQRIPVPPTTTSTSTSTETKLLADACCGEAVATVSIGLDPILPRRLHIETQTDTSKVIDAEFNTNRIEWKAMYSQTMAPVLHHFGVNTEQEEKEEKAKIETSEQETMTSGNSMRDGETQVEEIPRITVTSDATAQTTNEETNSEEKSEKLTPTPIVNGIDHEKECGECAKRRDTFTRNVGVGACSVADKICVACDDHVEEVDENEAPGFKVEEDDTKAREFELAKTNAVKKLLTSEQKNNNFVRGTAMSKSARFERKRSVDDLEYIEQKKKAPSAPATTPNGDHSEALKAKVILKKEVATPPSSVPEPIPAKIPRPKISKYATPEEAAQTPDEEAEAADRLTPLRSELRSLGRWPRTGSPHIPYSSARENLSDSEGESDDSEGAYDTNEDAVDGTPFEVTTPLREALESLNSHLLQPGTVAADTAEWALKYVQHEWMKTASRKVSRFDHVDKLVDALRELGPLILKTVVNITDQNGNSALHYAVSHANFSVVSSLLDSGECQLNNANKAGYTAVMLAALSSLEDDMERAVVQRLFEMGDVNARATQHGQTALMLAVSHGKRPTTELLLQCGADVNIQDEEGSTALMCAAEHGHRELVKLLLSQPEIDASLTDCDSSTALSIAVENGHRDIGVLIYAHLNYSRLDTIEPSSTI